MSGLDPNLPTLCTRTFEVLRTDSRARELLMLLDKPGMPWVMMACNWLTRPNTRLNGIVPAHEILSGARDYAMLMGAYRAELDARGNVP